MFDIGENIRKFRKLQGITQEELAEASDLSVKYISMLESKKFQNISINKLAKIADALSITVNSLISSTNGKDLTTMPYTDELISKLMKMPKNNAELISKNTLNTIRLFKNIYNQ